MSKENKKDYKISIIVPIYNSEKYLDECLKSISNQTYDNIEVILIDDGSIDNSKGICEKYVENDNRFKYYYKENGGISSTRNDGIKYVTGDYIFFVDSDDYIDKDACEILNKEFKKNNLLDILCFRYANVVENNKCIVDYKYKNEKDDIKYILGRPSIWSKAYKKDIFLNNNINFPEEKIYEDLAVIPSLILYTKSIKFIDDVIYYYRIRENSIMHIEKFNINRDDKFFALDNLINKFIEENQFNKYYQELEFIVLKHLIVVYSMEILKYSKDIYKSRLQKVKQYINSNFPNWKNNKYYICESKKTKVFINSIMKGNYLLSRFIIYIAKKIKKEKYA